MIENVSNTIATKKEILFKEWDHCENGIRSLDITGMKIRTWGITIFGAIVGFSIREQNIFLLLSVFPIVIAFWFFDGLFKRFQKVFIDRNREVCNILREVAKCSNDSDLQNILKISDYPSYDEPFRISSSIKMQLRTMLIWHVSFLYLSMVVIA